MMYTRAHTIHQQTEFLFLKIAIKSIWHKKNLENEMRTISQIRFPPYESFKKPN